MKQILKSAKPVSAEKVAKMADQGKNISNVFTGEGRMVRDQPQFGLWSYRQDKVLPRRK
jgi:hypothetical protein